MNKLNNLAQDKLSFSNEGHQWSIMNVIEHIVLSEELSINYALKKVDEWDKLSKVEFKSRIRILVLRMVLKLNLKYKAPKAARPVLSKTSLTELNNRWEAARIQLYNLSTTSPDVLNKGILKHPFVGVMNFNQMLQFFEAHFEHHILQINKLVERK
jgi:hypothetical protein